MTVFDQLRAIYGGTNIADIVMEVVKTVLPPMSANTSRVDLERICRMHAVNVDFVNEAPFQGRFEWTEGGPHITVRRDPDDRRQRFTLAHEMGHWLIQSILPTRKRTLFRGIPWESTAEVQEEEAIADALATELLMPRRMFAGPARDLNVINLARMTEMYAVPQSALLMHYSMVTGQSTLFATVIPTRLGDEESAGVIDRALITDGSGVLRTVRRELRFADRLRFQDLDRAVSVELELDGDARVYDVTCRYRSGIAPRVEMLALSSE